MERILTTAAALMTLTLSALPAAAQSDPPYLTQMPTPAAVIQEVKDTMKAADATHISARQLAIFTILPHIVERLQPANRYRKTPDEIKLMDAYSLAGYEISQAFAKAHTPEEVKAFDVLHGQMELDSAIYPEILDKIFSPEMRSVYNERMGTAAFGTRSNARPAGQAPPLVPVQAGRQDAGTLAVHRCVELGGSELECAGKGMTTGLFDLAGVAGLADIVGKPSHSGLIMLGSYSAAGSANLLFAADTVSVTGCGQLVQDEHPYTIERKGAQLLINIQNQPRPLVVTWSPAGGITGPGPLDITGRIITGYHVYDVVQRRVSDNSIIPGTAREEREPIYAPKVEHCSINALSAPPPAKPGPGLLESVLSQFVSSQTGPRMAGTYVAAGARVEFQEDFSVLDCGEAHVRAPYSVESTAGQLLLRMQNPGAPFTFALQPDGTLTASGPMDVSGRVITGWVGDEVQFAPTHARCAVTQFAPAK